MFNCAFIVPQNNRDGNPFAPGPSVGAKDPSTWAKEQGFSDKNSSTLSNKGGGMNFIYGIFCGILWAVSAPYP